MTIQQRPIAIPEPVNQVDALWRTCQALKEAVEVLQGQRGNRAAALVTQLNSEIAYLQRQIANITTGGGVPSSDHPHTGEVTGTTALAVQPLAITNKTDVVADSADDVMISDDSDSGSLKKVNLSSITDAGYF